MSVKQSFQTKKKINSNMSIKNCMYLFFSSRISAIPLFRYRPTTGEICCELIKKRKENELNMGGGGWGLRTSKKTNNQKILS